MPCSPARAMEILTARSGDVLVVSPRGPSTTRAPSRSRRRWRRIWQGAHQAARSCSTWAGSTTSPASASGSSCSSRQARAQGGTVVIAALQPLVREIFEISKFTLVFCFPTVADALADLVAGARPGAEQSVTFPVGLGPEFSGC